MAQTCKFTAIACSLVNFCNCTTMRFPCFVSHAIMFDWYGVLLILGHLIHAQVFFQFNYNPFIHIVNIRRNPISD